MPDEGKHQQEKAGEGGKRRALVLAAFARIASDGFEGLRTRDVAADAGVNIGTLHYYFPSKEALIRATVRHTTARFAATMAPGGTPAEQLHRHLEGMRRLLKHDQALWAVLGEVTLRAARDDALAELMRHAEDGWYGFLRDLIGRGIERGCLAPGLQADRAASLLITAIKGLSMPALGSFRPERVDLTIDQLEQWLGVSEIQSTTSAGGSSGQ